MTKLFVHLGLHKTGTTAVQRHLDAGRYHLFTRCCSHEWRISNIRGGRG